MGFEQSTSLDVRFDAASSRQALVETDDSMEASMPGDGTDVSAAPFAVRTGAGYVVHVVTEKTWTYALVGKRLSYRGGRVRTRLRAPGFPPARIAAQYKVDAARLAAFNPARDPGGRWTGLVLVRDDLPPYLPDGDDGLCGDGPCDDDPCEANL